MIPGCVGQAGIDAKYAPNCYAPDSTPVMSYRHTHYKNRRLGAVGDLSWERDFGTFTNVLRAGVWYENGESSTIRDWQKVTDARVSYLFNSTPYWVQFEREYSLNQFVYYVDNAATFGNLTARVGAKQYRIDLTRTGVVGDTVNNSMNYNSKLLLSGGLNYRPMEGLEVFAGYAENFAAISRGLLEQNEEVRREVKPETADSIEAGVRYSNNRFTGSITVYDINFNNRVVSIASNFVTGIDYLSQVESVWYNVGGVKSRGVELAAAYRPTRELQISGSYSYNSAKYQGTGDAARDAAAGIVPGVQVYNTPKHMLVGSVDYKGELFKAGISSKYVSSRFIDKEGTDPSGSFVLTNAYVGVELEQLVPQMKGLDLTVTVNNLTNERYLAGADGGSAFLGSPRTVMASLTLDF